MTGTAGDYCTQTRLQSQYLAAQWLLKFDSPRPEEDTMSALTQWIEQSLKEIAKKQGGTK